jgi:hypothetical protein
MQRGCHSAGTDKCFYSLLIPEAEDQISRKLLSPHRDMSLDRIQG